jgi:uncharacterized OB-fold protein
MSASDVLSNLTGLVAQEADGPHLIGSRCADCTTDTFPVQASCPRCGSEAVNPVVLPAAGTIWTWTVQRFAPKPPFRAPTSFAPFAVAYVDLGTVRVEARLAGRSADDWKIGDPVRLAVGPLSDADPDWQAYWFEPLQKERR